MFQNILYAKIYIHHKLWILMDVMQRINTWKERLCRKILSSHSEFYVMRCLQWQIVQSSTLQNKRRKRRRETCRRSWMGPGQHIHNESKVSHFFRLLAFSNLMCITHQQRKRESRSYWKVLIYQFIGFAVKYRLFHLRIWQLSPLWFCA